MTSVMGPTASVAAPPLPREPEPPAEDERVEIAAETQEPTSSPSRVPEDAQKPRAAAAKSLSNGGEKKEDDDEDEDDEDEEEEEDSPPRPRRTTRARLIMVEESESDKEHRSRGRLRKGSQPKKPKPKDDSESPSDKPKRRRGRQAKQQAASDDTGSESPGDYVHVEVGDCVLLDSGDPDDHFVALVSSVQLSQSSDKPTGFTAQWYYKPDDIRDEVRASIPGGVLPNEVFLSPHKDKNSIDAVVGLCNVVPAEEYVEIEQEIARGFREKSHKPYYVCRFKYYPSRSVKKALEPLKEEEVRGGLGPQKPKVGEEYQATIPEMHKDKPTPIEEGIPWRLNAPAGPDKSVQVWSRHVVAHQELIFRQFRAMLDTIRFSIGNVVRLYRASEKTAMGHVRCIVLKFAPSEAIEIVASTGERKAALKGELCSPLREDVAFQILYAARFNLSHAVQQCTKQLVAAQHNERDAFKKEILIFAQIAAQEKAKLALEESNNRKRRK